MGAQLFKFTSHEAANLDGDRIQLLRRSLGDQRCREIISEVVFHLTDRMTLLGAALTSGDRAEAKALTSRLAGLAEQVGLSLFAEVARDLHLCLRAEDPIAIAAVHARLGRIAERSLCDVMRHADPAAI
jgi:hypothetical protein